MKNYKVEFERFFSKASHPAVRFLPLSLVVVNLLGIVLWFVWPWFSLVVMVLDGIAALAMDFGRRKFLKQILPLKRIVEGFTIAGSHVRKILDSMTQRNFVLEKLVVEKESLSPDAVNLIDLAQSASEHMKTVINQLNDLSLSLGRVSEKILQGTGEQASASSEQAASVAEITATMEELAKTAAQIAHNSDDVFKVANQTEDSSGEGFNAVQDTIHNIHELKSKIDIIQSNAKNLGEKSGEINKILNLITEIANETHLLALNASIESVAAGEYGKRFGVVAMEVRRLAERSSESAENIKQLLEQFQDSINSTILSTEEGVKAVGKTIDTAGSAVERFAEIQELVEQTNTASKEISIATQQQRTASEQIVLTLKEISEVSNQSAENLNASTEAAEDLTYHAKNVQLFAQTFTVAKSNNIKYLLSTFVKNEYLSASESDRKMAVRAFLDRHTFFEAIFASDSNGRLKHLLANKNFQVDVAPLMAKNYSDKGWFRNVMQKRSSWVTEPYLSDFSSEHCFTVAVPYIENDEVVEIVAADINMKKWNEIG